MPSAQHFPPALSGLEMTPDSVESHEIQPQVITGCMIPVSLAKRIFSHSVTDYFQVYFWVNGESLLSLADLFVWVGLDPMNPIHAVSSPHGELVVSPV